MKKILWICDSFSEKTAYANISEKLCKILSNRYKIIYFFINTLSTSNQKNSYTIHIPREILEQHNNPSIKDYYYNILVGCYMLSDIITIEKPDIVVSINDYQIVQKHLEIVKSVSKCMFIPYVPIDCEKLPVSFFDSLKKADFILTMTEHSRKILSNSFSNVFLLPHYIDNCYYPLELSKKEIRKKIYPSNIDIEDDSIIILNINNSGIRKRLDIFIESLYILNNKICISNILYVLKTNKDFNLHEMILLNNKKYNIDLTRHFILLTEKMNNEDMNLLYNSANIFVTTTSGEGFGLPPFESICCNVFTLVPDNTCYPEYFPLDFLIKCETKTYKEGRDIIEIPRDDIYMVFIQGIPSYKNTTIEYLQDCSNFSNFNCRKEIIDCNNFESQLNDIVKEKTPFQLIIKVDITNSFIDTENIIKIYRKVDFNNFEKWDFTISSYDSFDEYISKVRIPCKNDLTDKIINYIKNPTMYKNIIKKTKNKLIKKLSLSVIEEQLLSLPFFV